eukprot:4307948-Lingulodinium_polyedra.AAC.1
MLSVFGRGAAAENAEHRLWRCPKWEALRRERTGGEDPGRLRVRLGTGVALAGVCPQNAALEALADVAR